MTSVGRRGYNNFCFESQVCYEIAIEFGICITSRTMVLGHEMMMDEGVVYLKALERQIIPNAETLTYLSGRPC